MKVINRIKGWFKKKKPIEIEAALKKYMKKMAYSKMEYARDLIEIPSLKNFSDIYDKDKDSLLLVITKLEHEFFKEGPTQSEMAAVEQVLARLWMFFKQCDEEYKLFEALNKAQAVKKK